jgi:hypothetical protein
MSLETTLSDITNRLRQFHKASFCAYFKNSTGILGTPLLSGLNIKPAKAGQISRCAIPHQSQGYSPK